MPQTDPKHTRERSREREEEPSSAEVSLGHRRERESRLATPYTRSELKGIPKSFLRAVEDVHVYSDELVSSRIRRTMLAAGHSTQPVEFYTASDGAVPGVVPMGAPYRASFPAPGIQLGNPEVPPAAEEPAQPTTTPAAMATESTATAAAAAETATSTAVETATEAAAAAETAATAATAAATTSEKDVGPLASAVIVLAGSEFVMLSKDDLERLIVMAGGVVVPSLTGPDAPAATHVVFGGGYGDLVLGPASEAGIPIVSEDWLFESLQYGVLLAEERFLVSFAPLDELAFVVADFGAEDCFLQGRSALAQLIYAYGGTLYDSITAKAKVRHMYYVVPLSVTYDQVSSLLEAQVSTVTILFESFVTNSVRKGHPDRMALHIVSRESFQFPGVEMRPVFAGTRPINFAARVLPSVGHLWYDLSSASKMDSGIGFVCPHCKEDVPGPKAFLRSHMIMHHFRGDFAPPGAPLFDSATSMFATQTAGVFANKSAGSRRYAAQAEATRRHGSSTGLRSGGAVTVWTDTDRCWAPACRMPPGPVQVLTCTQCDSSFHGVCLQLSPSLIENLTDRYDWRCNECKACNVCGESSNDASMLFCDACDKAYHTFCLDPPLKSAPRGSWLCTDCEHYRTKRRSRQITGERRNVLLNWLRAHTDNPYPTDDEKGELARLAGVPKPRITTWFLNARRRILPQILKELEAQQ